MRHTQPRAPEKRLWRRPLRELIPKLVRRAGGKMLEKNLREVLPPRRRYAATRLIPQLVREGVLEQEGKWVVLPQKKKLMTLPEYLASRNETLSQALGHR